MIAGQDLERDGGTGKSDCFLWTTLILLNHWATRSTEGSGARRRRNAANEPHARKPHAPDATAAPMHASSKIEHERHSRPNGQRRARSSDDFSKLRLDKVKDEP